MLYKWFRRAGYYLEGHWGLVPYTPILLTFIFGATLRIIVENKRPIRFEDLGAWVYGSWCAIGLLCPILMFGTWMLTLKGGRARVVGMWLRLGVDNAILSYLLTFHIADTAMTRQGRELTESHLFSRYLLASTIIFMLVIVIRDNLAIAFNFYKVRKIRNVRQP